MGKYRVLYILVAIMTVLSMVIGGVAIGVLHQTAMRHAGSELTAAVKTQARLIDAIARFDRAFTSDFPAGADKATIAQIRDAFATYNGFGETGEFVVGKRDGKSIVFILRQRNIQLEKPAPVPIDSTLAEPMRLALAGRSGTIEALDYRAVKVLAAYEPIGELSMGLVAKIDVSEIRAPFIRAVYIVGVVAIVAIVIGSWLFYRATSPVVRRLERQTEDLRSEISERKLAEIQLRKLSEAMNQSPNMVFITDLQGNIEYVNPRFTEMTGYSADEAIGMNPRILKSADMPAEVFAEMWETLLSGREWRGEVKDRRKDGGAFWASMVAAPVLDEHGALSHFIAIHEDITDKKLVEEQTRRAREQAEIANRAKSELIANMSHELRTPLNAVIGFSDGIMQQMFGPVGSEKYLEYASDIHSSGQHLLELINDILDVSVLEAGRLELHEERLSVPDLVEASLRLVSPRAGQGGVRISADCSPSFPLLCADPRRMKQILLNLLSNAVKFTPDGGEVSVDCRMNGEGGLAISVRDTGIGMTEEELAKAMTEFGQVDSGLDRKHEGTGLGLPLTKGLVEVHGGTLSIESERGKGTVATVRLPASRMVESFGEAVAQ